jgi:glycosyltransferase involved in cell wall biosynthesis
MKISAVVLTKNEENNIIKCLETLKFCDEIIVIDDYSSDNTQSIVKIFRAKLFLRKLDNNFANQRNFGLEKAKNEWVLFLDSDERITKKLSDEINNAIEEPTVSGYFIKRIDNIWGKVIKHGETGNIKLLRLARRNAGKWKREVHEEWIVYGKTKLLVNSIIHYPHQTFEEYIKDINYFSDLHAKANFNEGKKSNIFKVIFYPKFKFIKDYFLYLGFLDSIQGLLIALIMSMHSFLSWSKLWILQKKSI